MRQLRSCNEAVGKNTDWSLTFFFFSLIRASKGPIRKRHFQKFLHSRARVSEFWGLDTISVNILHYVLHEGGNDLKAYFRLQSESTGNSQRVALFANETFDSFTGHTVLECFFTLNQSGYGRYSRQASRWRRTKCN